MGYRENYLNLLEDAGCSNDSFRLSRFLLSNTKLRIKINGKLSSEFESVVGSFQGDCLSGLYFTLTLAGGLRHLRAVCTRPNPPIATNCMPIESEYADDIDLFSTSKNDLEEILPVAVDIFEEWNLFINSSKTEFTHLYLNEKNEQWRDHKILGSKLDSATDVKHRIILANVAFSNFSKIWMQKQISCECKLHLYDALVVSVLLYNSNSWSLTKKEVQKIDVLHRNHLRKILKIFWPKIISNESLYAVTNQIPLSSRINKSRWSMLGHVLRLPENSPAFTSMVFALEGANEFAPRVGRPQTNLLSVIRNDLFSRGFLLDKYNDLVYLKEIASDRKLWLELF